MSDDSNLQTVKAFFAAVGEGDRRAALALLAEEIAWIIPGYGWPLAGVHRGHAGVTALFDKASTEVKTTYLEPPDYFAAGDRIFQVGRATGTITATGKPFEDDFVFAITVRDGKLTAIREYVDTQALARASQSARA